MGAAQPSLGPLKGHGRNTAKQRHAGSVEARIKLQDGDDKRATRAKRTTGLLKEATTTGARNVRFLHACRKIQELTHE